MDSVFKLTDWLFQHIQQNDHHLADSINSFCGKERLVYWFKLHWNVFVLVDPVESITITCYNQYLVEFYYWNPFIVMISQWLHYIDIACKTMNALWLHPWLYTGNISNRISSSPPVPHICVSVLPGTFSPPPRVSDPDIHHGTCVTHVPWCMSGSFTSCFLWSRWCRKRSRHSRCMHNPQFYVIGKRPIVEKSDIMISRKCIVRLPMLRINLNKHKSGNGKKSDFTG